MEHEGGQRPAAAKPRAVSLSAARRVELEGEKGRRGAREAEAGHPVALDEVGDALFDGVVSGRLEEEAFDRLLASLVCGEVQVLEESRTFTEELEPVRQRLQAPPELFRAGGRFKPAGPVPPLLWSADRL